MQTIAERMKAERETAKAEVNLTIAERMRRERAPQAAPAAKGRISSPLPSEPSPPFTEEQLKTMEAEGIPVTGTRPIEQRSPFITKPVEGAAAIPTEIAETAFHLGKGAVGYIPSVVEEFTRLGIGTIKGFSAEELEEYASHAGEWLGPGSSSSSAEVAERFLTPIFEFPRKIVSGEIKMPTDPRAGMLRATQERLRREAVERGEEYIPTSIISKETAEKLDVWTSTTLRVGLELLGFKALHSAISGAKSKLKIRKRTQKLTPEEYKKIAEEIRKEAEVELDKRIEDTVRKEREAKNERVRDEQLRERERLQKLQEQLPKVETPEEPTPPKATAPEVPEPTAPVVVPKAPETPVFSHWKETFSTTNPYIAYYKLGDKILPGRTLKAMGHEVPEPPPSPVTKAKVKPVEPKVEPKAEPVKPTPKVEPKEPTFGVKKAREKSVVTLEEVQAEAKRITDKATNLDELYHNMQELATRYEEHPRMGFKDEIETASYREWGDDILGKINDARRKQGMIEAEPSGPVTAVVNDRRVSFVDPTEGGGFETRKSAEIYRRAFGEELGEIIENPYQAGRYVFEVPTEAPKPLFSDAQLNTFIPLNKVPRAIQGFFKRDQVTVREVTRNRDLWKATGFWYGQDGKFRYEINPSKAKLEYPEYVGRALGSGNDVTFKLGNVLDYPELYEIFPKFKNTALVISPTMESKAAFNRPSSTISLRFFNDKRALLHEIQHAVNEEMGAFEGSSYYHLRRVYSREMPEGEAATRAWKEYTETPGEMEARLTSWRSWMSDKRRAHEAPWETLDMMLDLEGVGRSAGTKLYSGVGGFQDMYESFVRRFKERAREKGQTISSEVNEVLDKGRVVSRRKIKGRYRPQVYEAELEVLKACEKIPQTTLHRAFENPIRTFREAGGEALLDLTIHAYHAREKGAFVLTRALRKSRNELKQGTTPKIRDNIMRYAISKQEFGREKLEFMGRGMLKELSPKEMEAYEALRARYEAWYHRLNNVRKSIGKEPFPYTEDYFTFLRNLSWLERAGFEPLQMPNDILNAQFVKMGSTPFPFEKPRSRTAYRLEMDPFHVLEVYENTAARYVQLSPLVAKLREYQGRMVDPETGEAFVLMNENPVLAASLQGWTNAIAGMKSPSFRLSMSVEKAMTKVNNNLVASILGANARSAMIQVTALRNTVAEIGPVYTTRGILSLVDPSKRNFAMQKSKVLSQRVIDIAVEDALRYIRAGAVGEAQKFGTRLAMKPLQLLDLETAKATWQGAYEMAVNKKGYTGRKAINFADDVVTRTQASGMIGDLAPIQRPVVGRFLTLFQTFTINDWDFLIKDVLGKRNVGIDSRAAFVKTIRYVAATTAFNFLLEDVLHINSPFPTPIRAFREALENGDDIPSLAIGVGKELIEPVPMFGAARYGKGPFGPGGELVWETAKFASRDPMARAWWELSGKWFGIPGTAQYAKSKRARTRGESLYGQVVGTYTPPKSESLGGLEGLEGMGGLGQ